MTGTPLVVLASLLIFGGLTLGYLLGIRGRRVDHFRPARRSSATFHLSPTSRRRALIGAVVGLVVAVVTGFVIAVVIAPVLAVLIPWLLSSPRGSDRIAKLEALEEWTRSLSGVIAAGRGIDEAIDASRRSAHGPIKPHIDALSMRLSRRWEPRAALMALAEDLDDPQADMVVALLIQGVVERAQGLSQMLSDMATSIGEEITSYRLIETEMKEASGTARAITIMSVVALSVIVLASGDYVAIYTSPIGQLLAIVLFAIYIGLLIVLRRISTMPPPPRLLGAKARAKVSA